MASQRELWLIIRARNNASRVLRRLARDLDDLAAKGFFDRAAQSVENVDKNLKDLDKTVRETEKNTKKLNNTVRSSSNWASLFGTRLLRLSGLFKILRGGSAGFTAGLAAITVVLQVLVPLVLQFGSLLFNVAGALAFLVPAGVTAAGVIGGILFSAFQRLTSAFEATEAIDKQKKRIEELTQIYGANAKSVINAKKKLEILKQEYAEIDRSITSVQNAALRLKSAWDTLVDGLVPTLFRDVALHLDNFAQTLQDPFLNKTLKELASTLNTVFQEISAVLGMPRTKFAIIKVIQEITKVLRDLDFGLITAGLVKLIRLGGAGFARLLEIFGQFVERFTEWVQTSEGEASINRIIETGLTLMQQLLDILPPLLEIFDALFGPNAPTEFLDILIFSLEEIAKFVKSPVGKKFIELMAEGAKAVLLLVGALGVAIGVFLTLIGVLLAIGGAVRKALIWIAQIAFAILVMQAKVLGILNRMKAQFFSIGKNLIQSLINGINNKVGALRNKANSIANTIKNTFRRAFQFGSPSKVMEKFGKFTMQGYFMGLEKELRHFSNRFNTMTRDTVGISARAAQASTTTNNTFNLGGISVANEVDDPRMLAAEIGFELEARLP